MYACLTFSKQNTVSLLERHAYFLFIKQHTDFRRYIRNSYLVNDYTNTFNLQ